VFLRWGFHEYRGSKLHICIFHSCNGTSFLVRYSFAHLLHQGPCVGYFNATSSLADFESLCPGVQLDRASLLGDILAAWLYSCRSVTHDISTSMDMVHVFYSSLRDKPVTYVCAGVQLDHVSRLRDMNAACLCPCIKVTHHVSGDKFYNFYLSICDKSPISFVTTHIPVFLVTVFKFLKFVIHTLDCSLYVFLQSDFATFLCLLVRNQFVHAMLMYCIPQEVPGRRACYIFLLMIRSMIVRHDFLARMRHFYARQLTFRSNVHGFYDAGGRSRLIELLYYSRDSFKLSCCFSLPSLFIVIQILISILTCHCPNFACLSTSTKGSSSTPSTLPSFSCDDRPLCHRVLTYGGGRQHEFSALSVQPHITAGLNYSYDSAFKFVDHVDSLGQLAYPIAQNYLYIHTKIPLSNIVPHLSVKAALKIARLHHLQIGSHMPKSEICRVFEGHDCIYSSCNVYVSVFAVVDSKPTRRRIHKAKKRLENRVISEAINMKPEHKFENLKSMDENKKVIGASHQEDVTVMNSTCSPSRRRIHKAGKISENGDISHANCDNMKHTGSEKELDVVFSKVSDSSTPFPPSPVDDELSQRIINDFCKDSLPSVIEEAGCAVCGQLVSVSQLTRVKGVKNLLHVLHATAVTRYERSDITQSIREYKGPVLDHACNQICDDCRQQVRKGKVPRYALANGLWLGAVPNVLSSLTYIERLLVARVRVNSCFIRVASSGLRKMASHVVAFESPVPKLYQCLPPPVEDLDDVLAILFTGPCKPSEEDFKRTPLLVRRKKVAAALEWLKLNHIDYADLDISYEELNRYPEHEPPVSFHYQHLLTNKVEEGTSVFDDAPDDGVEEGDCPFVVHGLTGDQLTTKSASALKGIALRHWNNRGAALAISHDASPQTIYNNPSLYPQIFPWLFPYGLGGIGSTKLSDQIHKRYLLMYHDKRFQRDPCFPFVAFSHQQIKSSTTGGFLLAETRKFDEIAERLLNINQEVLQNIAQRMSVGEIVKPSSNDEVECFQLIRDLDHIDGKVSGSITSKKYMRSEIWSMIAYMGAPVWYITLSPADNKHPICLYFADDKEKLDVTLMRPADERYRLIARNPVAGARFFHFMIEMFIRHVLGVGTDHRGLYGETSGYYGTVEQQGRLTLHLHMLLWIRGCLTPDEIRSKILDPNSDFRLQLVQYLESAHAGDFILKDRAEVHEDVHAAEQDDHYRDPTETLPEAPPSKSDSDSPKDNCDGRTSLTSIESWLLRFRATVNDLLLKSNIHKCSTNRNKDGSQNKARPYKGCLDNIWGKCKARFPRPLFNQTEVNMETGTIDMKKRETWLNTFTYVVTYLFRCNTDITSLRSGTAIKGVLLYVSNYVTKPALKTHVIFETVRSMFQRHSEVIGGSDSRKNKARKLMTKIVNSLSAKLEIGSPMASMYLLGNPDHYTNFNFIPFYWQSFVREARKPWEQTPSSSQELNTDIAQGDSAKPLAREGCPVTLNTTNIPNTSNTTALQVEQGVDEHPEKLTIFKRNGRIIGFSPVHDYIYRPTQLRSMCLYDWISMCKREKLPVRRFNKIKKDVQSAETYVDEECSSSSGAENTISVSEDNITEMPKTKLLRFISSHPLADTHGVRYLKTARIPNFVGNTLPRHDQGDREYYCSTMLALFKPWRSGLDLRCQTESWDDAFLSHTFSSRQLEVMKNMNIRYECLDARDDFHAQMKKGAASMPSWAESGPEIFNDLDQIGIDNVINVPTGSDELSISPIMGKSERMRTELMTDVRRMLMSLGWTNHNADLLPDGLNLSHSPIQPQTPAEWKAAVSNKRAEILEERARNLPANINSDNATVSSSSCVPNDVRVVNKSYMSRSFSSKVWEQATKDVSKQFHLNEEQDRAFRIVANHACSPDSDQLKMNIAGMAGTGKSQVLKALVHFFKLRKESHRFIIVAPTGSAAALLQGSTYHSVFGINSDGKQISGIQLAQVKERLVGVDYVFLDEVSMLSCRDMYLISARLARVMNNLDSPFGGLNFIFAGDFAQLPPVIGNEHASLYSRTVGMKATSLRDQEAAIGKALWHQVTTVVILRQNMRQQMQSPEDIKFREALANMRYKACTSSDIAFLRSRISSELPGRRSVNEKEFRNISIITNLNSQKDEINRLGSLRFAAETGQTLTHFFSVDNVVTKEAEENEQRKRYKAGQKRSVKHGSIPPAIQNALWEQPTCANTKLIPGKLSICIGMPVMIRNNAATEMGITKGQEAIVHTWDSHKTTDGRDVLDTLFVELSNPPSPIKLDDLPLNVVPLTRTSVTTCCRLPDDSSLTVSRSQVEVHPNFAMTDYASQGKTRPHNVVDLSQARSHQSYYTALSRSATAAGTLILNSIHPSKITGGASGALRQEFRELELLDDITALQFDDKLPTKIAMADHRNTLIKLFVEWKGEKYMPSKVHPAIQWCKSDPFLESQDTNVHWRVIDSKVNDTVDLKSSRPGSIPNIASKESEPDLKMPDSHVNGIPSTSGLKRKRDYNVVPTQKTQSILQVKKVKFCHNATDTSRSVQLNNPLGTQWHNNSCAYDAIITVLFNIWYDPNPEMPMEDTQCVMFNALIQSFRTHERHQADSGSPSYTLEEIRDFFRRQLARISQDFTFGSYACVQSIGDRLFRADEIITTSNVFCPDGHSTDSLRERRSSTSSYQILILDSTEISLQACVDNFTHQLASKCQTCDSYLMKRTMFVQSPPLLAFDISSSALTLDPVIWISCLNSRFCYVLRGVIYFQNQHFTERVVTSTGMIWYHDGIFTGPSLVYESQDLTTIAMENAIMAFYARSPLVV
jgi:uncharacterized protein DUF6570/helitron helicase-like protein/PIF1-like helicase